MAIIFLINFHFPGFNPLGRGYGLGLGPSNYQFSDYSTLIGTEFPFGRYRIGDYLSLFPIPSIDIYQRLSNLADIALTSDYHLCIRDRGELIDPEGKKIGEFTSWYLLEMITPRLRFNFKIFRYSRLSLSPGISILYNKSWTSGLQNESSETRKGYAPSLKGGLWLVNKNKDFQCGLIFSLPQSGVMVDSAYHDTVNIPESVTLTFRHRIRPFTVEFGYCYQYYREDYQEFPVENFYLSGGYEWDKKAVELGISRKNYMPSFYRYQQKYCGIFFGLIYHLRKIDLAVTPFYEFLYERYSPDEGMRLQYLRYGLRVEVGIY
ncbi:hypothetical protein DRP53_02295 [candidate division WOR-3 bacterium]|uniref:Uncharacterized protein n=1 Tax=candidate division WOR-3 bacterium TaxID=2052148 RepID=A0A660SKF0_UNCW3|nr:MAG: hypothetical protein DRP53_02295 [candidate division WOR-3 bacterium]